MTSGPPRSGWGVKSWAWTLASLALGIASIVLGVVQGSVVEILVGTVLVVVAFRREPDRAPSGSNRERILRYFGLR